MRALMTMTAVLEYLRAHRAVRDVPLEYLAGQRRALGATGLSQSRVAAMVGINERTYREFEHDGVASPATVRAVAAVLGASRAQHAAMWRWIGRPVPPDLQPPARPADPDLAAQLTGAAHYPAVWLTPEWDVLDANEPAAAHLGPLARPGANWAAAILGPDGEARPMLTDWQECARPMLEALRMAVADPARSQRMYEVAVEVWQHPPTAALWQSCAEMREDLDGVVLRAHLPGMSPMPVELRLSTLAHGDARLVVLRPIVTARRVDRTEAARAVPSAQQLADALVEMGATVGVVNYPLPDPDLLPRGRRPAGLAPVGADGSPPDLDVRLRRAAIATVAAYTIGPDFLRPGAPIPTFPGTSATIARHMRGQQIVCDSREAMEQSVGRRPELIAALIPDPPPSAGALRIGRVAHAPLTVPDPDTPAGVRILGSIEAHRTEDLPPFTGEELAWLRHLAAVRGAAMAREAAAARDAIWSKAG